MEPLSAEAPHRIARPVMLQTWRHLTFLHWRYEPAEVQPLVPAGLNLDLYDGAAWVGLVPFVITGLTHPRLPPLPWISHFPETNVRTYVTDGRGQRGVWFFSLDAARLAAVIGARAAFALPYYWARMKVDWNGREVRYFSTRLAGRQAASAIEVAAEEEIPRPSELEIFLTARFRLYARRRDRLLQAEIEHPPWPLRQARVVRLTQNLLAAAGLPAPHGEPLAHFSSRVDVRVAPPGPALKI